MLTIHPTSFTRKLIGLCIFILFLVVISIFYTGATLSATISKFQGSKSSTQSSCLPQDYSAGEWVYSPHTTKRNMSKREDALEFAGLTGCASLREVWWHLAADNENQWDRFPAAQSWAWSPGRGCKGLRPLDPKEFIKDLVVDGGWYLVGDSVMENQFFSLSCILYGDVIATTDYSAGRTLDRDWPQHLYLSPNSSLLSSIQLPENFDLVKTPLVSFRRIDVLLSKQELVEIHREMQPPNTTLEDDSLFGESTVWTVPLDEYLNEFLSPLPKGNYNTMIVSTAGRWTIETFPKTTPPGIDGVLILFMHAVKRWADRVEARIKAATDGSDRQAAAGLTWRSDPLAKKGHRRRQVVVRSYLPGHEDCHGFRKPWKTVEPFKWNWWNWGEIWKFNYIFETLLSNRKEYSNIHYLGIDKPARLRPDAHATGDCLHIMTGAGILEGWAHYVWHYITREISI